MLPIATKISPKPTGKPLHSTVDTALTLQMCSSHVPLCLAFPFNSPQTMIPAHLSTSHCLNPGCPHREFVYACRHKAVYQQMVNSSLGLPRGYPSIFALGQQDIHLTLQARTFLWLHRI